jgi:hypothetical protein
MQAVVFMFQGPRFAKSCGGWVASSLVPTPCRHPHTYVSLLFSSTKRPPMLWGSTCRAVTSFRPYELVGRARSLRMYASNAYIYQQPNDRRPTEQRVYLSIERVCLPTYRSTYRTTDCTYGRWHRTATRIVLFD